MRKFIVGRTLAHLVSRLERRYSMHLAEQDVTARKPRTLKTDFLSVVLKVAERCNLACPYCYFFFGGDDSYLLHPAFISD
ncbi:MAG TPA: hypothetical protein VGU66_11380, partial [Candidatus Elarobacter sp.]|nr:hypothetical protein [Candidatus Elarobacter sp.]